MPAALRVATRDAAVDFAAIVPILFVTLAALAAMLAEAFRRQDERMPIGALGIIGLVGATRVRAPVGPQAIGFGVIVGGQLRSVLHAHR